MESVGSDSQVYSVAQLSRLKAYLFIAGGLALIVWAVVQFLLVIRFKSNMIELQISCTLPTMGAIGCFAAAWRSLRSPAVVRLTDLGLEIQSRNATVQAWEWEQIAFVKTSSPALSQHRQLTVYGDRGQILAKLSQDFEAFDLMLESIQRYVAEHPSPARSKVERSKAVRRGIGLMIGGVIAWGLAGANLWIVRSDSQARQLLNEKGQLTTATVIQKLIAPDGHTHRLYYRVDNVGANAPESNVEIDPTIWLILQPGMKFVVKAVPGRPDISHLIDGQVDDSFAPPPNIMMLVCAGICILGIIFFVGGFLGYRGKNIKLRKPPAQQQI